MEVNIEEIKPSPYQPRTSFDHEDIKELIDSIRTNGLLMPLVVREVNGFYELIDGDRRLHALKILKMKTARIDVIVASDSLARRMVWKINRDREDYTVEEEARYFKKLNDGGMSFYQIGKELDEDDNWVLAHINVFKFPDDIQQAVWKGTLISISHIQRLEPVIGANIDRAIAKAKEIMLRKLSVAETEKFAQDEREAEEKMRVDAAKKAVSQITNVGVMTPIEFSVPEDYEKAAKLLKEKAKSERLSKLSEEEKIKLEEEKIQKQKEKNQKHKQKQQEHDEKLKVEAEKEAKEKLLKDPEIIKNLANDPEAKKVIIEQLRNELQPVIALSPEDLKAIQDAKDDITKMEMTADFHNVARNKNWLAHGQLIAMAESLRCPCCGESIKKLVWSCCGISVEEAYRKLQDVKMVTKEMKKVVKEAYE